MHKKIIWFILSVVFLCGSIIGIILGAIKEIAWVDAVCSTAFSIALEFTYLRLQDLFDKQSWQISLRKHLRGKLIKKTDYIRISFAYLFRIKINGQYLLVKNERGTGKFQPIGGVYKYYDEEKTILTSRKYCVLEDSCIKIDGTSKNDYRMRVPVKVC